jgi:hypothetical protein
MSNEQGNPNDEARLRPTCAVFTIRAAPHPAGKSG